MSPRSWSLVLLIGLVVAANPRGHAEPPPLTPAQQTAIREVKQRASTIQSVNRAIWEFAELGLEETKSAALLVEQLRAAGFLVETGVAGMPTAFVASYGQGRPIIGLLAEYDALPELSQEVSTDVNPVTTGAPGHGCGHSGLGAGALGAILALKATLEEHQLPGTIRLYGTPAEETTIGKVYMTLDGLFDDLDACLHWHPSTKNEVWHTGAKALVSAKFSFMGLAAHAAGNPDQGRSALDAVELMNVGVNYMREHVKEDARIHYVITHGGGAPNVVPATATVWYYVRANTHTDAEGYFRWVDEIARGAALMTRTKLAVAIDTDCHELIPNLPLAEVIQRNLERLPPPKFTPQEHEFARRLQQPLIDQFGVAYKETLDERIHPIPANSPLARGSTDVGDISWHVPTCGLRTTCFPVGSPGHCWQNVAAIGSTIGEKGTIYAAQVLAATAIDLLEHPDQLAAAKADFVARMKDHPYQTLIPEGQQPPRKIR
jgi:aminobenzoyl-glutamate utilization protein B